MCISHLQLIQFKYLLKKLLIEKVFQFQFALLYRRYFILRMFILSIPDTLKLSDVASDSKMSANNTCHEQTSI